MEAREIDHMLELGYWIQVSPLANAGSGWICGIYKRGKISGNWITEVSKKFDNPLGCFEWADKEIVQLINKVK